MSISLAGMVKRGVLSKGKDDRYRIGSASRKISRRTTSDHISTTMLNRAFAAISGSSEVSAESLMTMLGCGLTTARVAIARLIEESKVEKLGPARYRKIGD